MKRSLRCAVALLGAALQSPVSIEAQPAGVVAESHLVPRTAEELGFRDFRGVLHAHSYLSHDAEIPHAEIIRACEETGVEFLCMTDHPSERSLTDALRGWHGKTFFLAGAEVNNFLAIDLERPIRAGDSQGTIDEIGAQNGVAIVAHSEEYKDWEAAGYAGMEIYNIHTDLKDEKDLEKSIAKLPRLLQDPEWAMTAIFNEPKDLLARWDQLTQSRRVTGVAGNDAHQNVRILGIQLDPYARSIGFVNTHILTLGLTRESIKDALASGHAYVCFTRFAPGNGFSYTAESVGAVAVMGDEIPWSEDLVLRAVFPREARIHLVCDGKVTQRVQSDDATFRVPRPGVYRVEGHLRMRGRIWPWIYSNPIYVRGETADGKAAD